MARLDLHFLGTFQVTLEGQPITRFRSANNQGLLVYLALNGERAVPREVLAALFWPEESDKNARNNLRQALYQLRTLLGDKKSTANPYLLVTRQTAQFNHGSDYKLDVKQFLDAVDVRDLQAGIDIYSGELLPGFTCDSLEFEGWLRQERESLHHLALEAMVEVTRDYLAKGNYEQAQAAARRQLSLEPWREPAHRQLMALHARFGQRSAALRQYQECLRILDEELGLLPSDETNSLHEDIRSGALGPGAVVRSPHNLPAQLTPFVGRENELADIQAMLRDPDCRLLTLVGPGGIGKTRLALRAAKLEAEDQPARFEHGVIFVRLGPLRSLDAILSAVADAVGFRFYQGGEPRQQLLNFLQQRKVLLLMDGFENLLVGVGLVTEILRGAPGVKILVTSRVRLQVMGEHLYQVSGMAYPEEETVQAVDEFSAVQLFAQSARRTVRHIEWTAEDWMAVVEICRLVDGMPLGILLAAAWVGMLKPSEIVSEINRGLDFLGADWGDLPLRQRKLRAVFDHSWRLLNELERSVMQALSVFRGGLTREAAQEVAGASLRDLRALVDKSFLQYTSSGRYDVHELLRKYAAEKLEASPTARKTANDRHCGYFTAALQRWEEDLKGSRQKVALSEMDADSENILAAWDWAVENGQIECLDRAIDGLDQYLFRRGRRHTLDVALRAAVEKLKVLVSQSGAEQVRSAHTASPVSALVHRVLARVLIWWGGLFTLEDVERFWQLTQQSQALLEGPELADQDTRREKALLLWQMGVVTHRSDNEQGRQLHQQSLELFRELDDGWGIARLLFLLALSEGAEGAHREAMRLLEESLTIYRAMGDQLGIARSTAGLAQIATRLGNPEEGERLAREGLALNQELEDRAGSGFALRQLGWVLENRGEFAEAHSVWDEELENYTELGDRLNIGRAHLNLGWASLHLGHYKPAQVHAQVAITLLQDYYDSRGVGFAHCLLGCIALADGSYSEAQRLMEEGAALYQEIGMRPMVDWVVNLTKYVPIGQSDPLRAGQAISEALQKAAETRDSRELAWILTSISVLQIDLGERERAVELYALASRNPYVANSRWFHETAGQQIAAVADSLPPEVVAAARQRGRARDLDATIVELTAELADEPG
jgi:predicted ATPase